jgi:hypothetical protein
MCTTLLAPVHFAYFALVTGSNRSSLCSGHWPNQLHARLDEENNKKEKQD